MENLFIFMEIKLSKKKNKVQAKVFPFSFLAKCLLQRMGFTIYPYESTVFFKYFMWFFVKQCKTYYEYYE